jgi:hypothetical protein
VIIGTRDQIQPRRWAARTANVVDDLVEHVADLHNRPTPRPLRGYANDHRLERQVTQAVAVDRDIIRRVDIPVGRRVQLPEPAPIVQIHRACLQTGVISVQLLAQLPDELAPSKPEILTAICGVENPALSKTNVLCQGPDVPRPRHSPPNGADPAVTLAAARKSQVVLISTTCISRRAGEETRRRTHLEPTDVMCTTHAHAPGLQELN